MYLNTDVFLHKWSRCFCFQSWADAFRSTPSLSGVVYVYDDLRRRGLEFPMTNLDTLSPIHTPNRVRLPVLEKYDAQSNADVWVVAHMLPVWQILQSIPENGTPEVTPAATPTHQSQPQAPASAPSENNSAPVQTSDGPGRLSPEQVPKPRASWKCLFKITILYEAHWLECFTSHWFSQNSYLQIL